MLSCLKDLLEHPELSSLHVGSGTLRDCIVFRSLHECVLLRSYFMPLKEEHQAAVIARPDECLHLGGTSSLGASFLKGTSQTFDWRGFLD